MPSTPTPIYWVDASVLITAKNGHYSFDLVPKFWNWLESNLKDGAIRMPHMSYEEIMKGNDELTSWCKHKKSVGHFCVRPSKGVQERYTFVAEHVQSTYGNKPHQVAEFMKGADGWVIAHALDTHGVVVTDENREHNKSKIKIPIVCKALSVTWRNTVDMCKELGAKFA
jgi:hypothetical protein